jgi:hypothetical protein
MAMSRSPETTAFENWKLFFQINFVQGYFYF